MMWIPFLVLLGGFAMFFGRRCRIDGSGACGREVHQGSRDPLDILKQRYAKGEIGAEEYEEARKRLQAP
jgi:putative membrane protein